MCVWHGENLHIWCQGLSSRKVGATSINSKSSRSHVMFTFIIESWCKVSFELLVCTIITAEHDQKIFLLFLFGFSHCMLVTHWEYSLSIYVFSCWMTCTCTKCISCMLCWLGWCYNWFGMSLWEISLAIVISRFL